MVTVYRVETAKRHGPYQSANLSKEQITKLEGMWGAHSGVAHPTPWVDSGLRGIDSFEYCAFESEKALRSWFDGYENILSECDFIVNEYEVEESAVRYGIRQCLVSYLEDYKPTRQYILTE